MRKSRLDEGKVSCGGHVPMRIEDGFARPTADQGVEFGANNSVDSLQWRVHASKRNHIEGRFDLVGRPDVPGESEAVSVLCLVEVLHELREDEKEDVVRSPKRR